MPEPHSGTAGPFRGRMTPAWTRARLRRLLAGYRRDDQEPSPRSPTEQKRGSIAPDRDPQRLVLDRRPHRDRLAGRLELGPGRLSTTPRPFARTDGGVAGCAHPGRGSAALPAGPSGSNVAATTRAQTAPAVPPTDDRYRSCRRLSRFMDTRNKSRRPGGDGRAWRLGIRTRVGRGRRHRSALRRVLASPCTVDDRVRPPARPHRGEPPLVPRAPVPALDGRPDVPDARAGTKPPRPLALTMVRPPS